MIGLTRDQFKILYNKIKLKLKNKNYFNSDRNSTRKRKFKKKIILFLVMLHLRQYFKDYIFSFFFQISQSTINRYINLVLNSINETFKIDFPTSEERLKNSINLFKNDIVMIIDGVEQRVTKSTFSNLEKSYYSSKKGFLILIINF
jgi:hypothetical protein